MERSESALVGPASAADVRFVQDRHTLPWLEPTEAYRRLRVAGHLAFLLDGLGAHPEARRSFIALTPVIELRVEGPLVTETRKNGGTTATRGNVLRRLRGTFDETRFPVHEPQGFTGGWVGFFGYEFSQTIEPSLPARKSDPGTPDALLNLCLDALVFDRAEKTLHLHLADLDGDHDALTVRAQDLRDILLRAAPPPRVPSAEEALVWTTEFAETDFCAAVAAMKERIAQGDLFQANIATRFDTHCSHDPLAVFCALQQANPSPYMALLEFPEFALVSASPEQLLSISDGALRSRPIAGTRKRGAHDREDAAMERELLTDAKEQAEHTMLVDLVRNDVAKVCEAGSVRVTERMSVERYSHVMHLVSAVQGRLRRDAVFVDALAALFPGGTVTGAPKVRACQRIHEAEPAPRGPYTGSAGYLSWSHNADWNILIRTLVMKPAGAGGWTASVHAGSGIVADSDPRREWREAQRKAEALLQAAAGRPPSRRGTRLGEVTRHGAWTPPRPTRTFPDARVLLVDNYDSFVHNLADYCASLGAVTRVIRNDADWRAEVATFRPSHVILSPGPGWPADAGCSKDVARELHGRIPVLGVCLGHQAIAEAHGGRVVVHPDGPVHGKTGQVLHGGAGLFAGIASPMTATRYHSLVVEPGTLGAGWRTQARLADGTMMDLAHEKHPTFGVQFHPESLCTESGLELIANFLECRA